MSISAVHGRFSRHLILVGFDEIDAFDAIDDFDRIEQYHKLERHRETHGFWSNLCGRLSILAPVDR